MAQINPIVGDLAGNRDRIIDSIGRARKAGADIVAFPELAVTGYPPEDLLLKPQFVQDNLRTLQEIQRRRRGITAVVGFVDRRTCCTTQPRSSTTASSHRLPQDPAAELRRLRRVPLFPSRATAIPSSPCGA